jgi:hypothetical protein
MSELIEEITKLTDEWYTLIGPDHHKEKDCHWYVETKWSHGHPPKYSVQHWGYIIGDIEEHWNTYELALRRLKEILTREIEEYKKDSEVNKDKNGW